MYPSKRHVLDLRDKIRTPVSKTRMIFEELQKLSSSSSLRYSTTPSIDTNEVERWNSPRPNRLSNTLPPNKAMYTPSRLQDLSMQMRHTPYWSRSKLREAHDNSGDATSSMIGKLKTVGASNNRVITIADEDSQPELNLISKEPLGFSTAPSSNFMFDSSTKAQTKSVGTCTDSSLMSLINVASLEKENNESEEQYLFSFATPIVRGPVVKKRSPSPPQPKTPTEPIKTLTPTTNISSAPITILPATTVNEQTQLSKPVVSENLTASSDTTTLGTKKPIASAGKETVAPAKISTPSDKETIATTETSAPLDKETVAPAISQPFVNAEANGVAQQSSLPLVFGTLTKPVSSSVPPLSIGASAKKPLFESNAHFGEAFQNGINSITTTTSSTPATVMFSKLSATTTNNSIPAVSSSFFSGLGTKQLGSQPFIFGNSPITSGSNGSFVPQSQFSNTLANASSSESAPTTNVFAPTTNVFAPTTIAFSNLFSTTTSGSTSAVSSSSIFSGLGTQQQANQPFIFGNSTVPSGSNGSFVPPPFPQFPTNTLENASTGGAAPTTNMFAPDSTVRSSVNSRKLLIARRNRQRR